MKSPAGFTMSRSFCQANPVSVTLRRFRVKMFSLVAGPLSAEGVTGSLEVSFPLRCGHFGPQ